jgi:cytochrome c553
MSTYTQEGAARSGTWRRLAAVAGAVASLAAFAPAHAQQAASAANGDSNGEPEYVWNELQGEKLIALRAKGDPARGEITFEVCQGCHRSHALGRPDGSYPRLAGQHDTVLIKQMTDVRAGRRKNDKMLPFIDKHGISPQDIADIAAFLTRLPVPPNNGKGPGTDLAAAEKTYQARCAVCHGKAGQGDEAKFYPRVSGQHFKYMLREMKDIRDGARGNANSDMVQVVRTMSDAQLESVADYMSRLPVAAK